MNRYLTAVLLLWISFAFSQDLSENYRTIKVAVQDTIVIDSVSINPNRFLILDKHENPIDSSLYIFDSEKAQVVLSEEIRKNQDSLTIFYLKYPSYLTKTYSLFDTSVISDSDAVERVYALSQSTRERNNTLFDGLSTYGSISRGITVGTNQNAVVNSELDLQITGKLSDKLSIRASIQDANIPMQEGGYSQSLDEFDQIFIELFTDNWNIRAGDIDLKNNQSYFANFEKKVQGIYLGGRIVSDESETTMYASGAVVKGIFSKTSFAGQEGNQGPYKLVGPNGELYVLIVSGSERVYVNGLLLERGENNDYVIDYNAGEVKFNPTYPITSDMRIVIEYQFTDRNYTRFVGFGGGNYKEEKFEIGAYAYIESDAKNQPLQQSLTEAQVQILKDAGDNPDAMTAPSAVPDTYSDNKILYKKEVYEDQEIFVFSNNPEDDLFFVRFTLVGQNQGNYIIVDQTAISRIFEFVPPVGGVPQGNYEPIVRLFAPTRLQIGGLNGNYKPSEKTTIAFELAASKNDLNLFSDLDKEDDNGFATKIDLKQQILNKNNKTRLDGYIGYNFIDKNFASVERLYNVEFDRDWSLPVNESGNADLQSHQHFLTAGLQLSDTLYGNVNYEFQKLDYSDFFTGNRHLIFGNVKLGNLKTLINSSYLKNNTPQYKTDFFRINTKAIYGYKKQWIGAKIEAEDNQQRYKVNDSLSVLSQRYAAYEGFFGVGDSTKVFAEIGYRYRINDSVRNSRLENVSASNTFYLKTQIIKTETSQLAVYANYRELKYKDDIKEKEQNINSRLFYNQSFLNRGIQWNTTFETNSGVIPQQEFTFVEVEPGQGTHTWIDYNGNGIQELEEFEVAQFADEAKYIKVLLPNQVFVKIHNNKFGQSLTINPGQFSENEKTKLLLSKFYNQTSFLIDRKTRRNANNFDINPFNSDEENQMGLALNFRNIVFFNRGKQRYTTSYSYTTSEAENLFSTGKQKNALTAHQVNFTHKLSPNWLANLNSQYGSTTSYSENYTSRNYEIEAYEISPKISYLFSDNAQFSLFYKMAKKENTIGLLEQLTQQTFGTQFSLNKSDKYAINGEFNYISNLFEGSAFSPVAFQMLEGLQPDKNFTWTLLLKRKITQYLDLNLSYFGRKSENSNTIHTGSVQLKAYF